MLDLSFRKIGPDTYRKWNAVLGVRTTLTFDRQNRKIHVRQEQPRALIAAVLERNVALQNGAKSSFKDDYVTQAASLPIAVHRQVMAQSPRRSTTGTARAGSIFCPAQLGGIRTQGIR